MVRNYTLLLVLSVLLSGFAWGKQGIVTTIRQETIQGDIREKEDEVIVTIRGIDTRLGRDQVAEIRYLPEFDEQLQQRLREQWRRRIERNASPSAAVIDSQSNRISPQGGSSGFDAGKKVKGRKRHLVVDTLGLLLAVAVTAASVQDRDAAPAAVATACAKYTTIEKLFADGAYAGQCADRLEHDLNITVDIVRRPNAVGDWEHPQQSLWPAAGGFVPLPKRWVVERTHAWLERERRLVMHHDRSPRSAVAWVWLAQARMLLRRLTHVG